MNFGLRVPHSIGYQYSQLFHSKKKLEQITIHPYKLTTSLIYSHIHTTITANMNEISLALRPKSHEGTEWTDPETRSGIPCFFGTTPLALRPKPRDDIENIDIPTQPSTRPVSGTHSSLNMATFDIVKHLGIRWVQYT